MHFTITSNSKRINLIQKNNCTILKLVGKCKDFTQEPLTFTVVLGHDNLQRHIQQWNPRLTSNYTSTRSLPSTWRTFKQHSSRSIRFKLPPRSTGNIIINFRTTQSQKYCIFYFPLLLIVTSNCIP
uniref:Uncharacterized protein n=1 Tax=Opuntia streptacantha TaxID=393608 RepID=A0A7C9AES4_OPUST